MRQCNAAHSHSSQLPLAPAMQAIASAAGLKAIVCLTCMQSRLETGVLHRHCRAYADMASKQLALQQGGRQHRPLHADLHQRQLGGCVVLVFCTGCHSTTAEPLLLRQQNLPAVLGLLCNRK